MAKKSAESGALGWHLRDRLWVWGDRTFLMGILNVTPDSFSDGGRFVSQGAALSQVRAMAGVIDILDVGGESTRPGAQAVDAATELARVLPIITLVRAEFPQLPISIDTMKSGVAAAALRAGADVVNDVSAGRHDPLILEVAAELGAPVVLMHMQGEPRTMQQQPTYGDVVAEVYEFLELAIARAMAAGIPRDRIAVDVGIGFGKSLGHNLTLLRHLSAFRQLNCPILTGVSRKSFIGTLCQHPNPQDRLWGTAAACTAAIAGGSDILRVHDPLPLWDVCRVSDALFR
ncbi:MAG: dihydropteroate synthase [Oscillatoriales cyanobacterium SM2_2_1]|nr:dihydropteroate synthase [Oscillatoriales cyanobacterium SM2_2_1]